MIIGVDPHKSSHAATAVSPTTNAPASSIRIDATLAGYRQLFRWAIAFPERQWAIENAHSLGCHLAQWIIGRELRPGADGGHELHAGESAVVADESSSETESRRRPK